jgi:hypothetical protein
MRIGDLDAAAAEGGTVAVRCSIESAHSASLFGVPAAGRGIHMELASALFPEERDRESWSR